MTKMLMKNLKKERDSEIEKVKGDMSKEKKKMLKKIKKQFV